MDELILWAGFAGAWLLVAGPLLQAAIELREQDLDRDEFSAVVAKLPRPAPPSKWWWLLPPVMYVLRRRQNSAYQKATLAELSEHQREQFVGFMNKATGWFTVAAGATFLAAKETWELVEHHEWPVWLFWVLMVVFAIASVVNMAVRMIRTEAIQHPDRVHTRPERRQAQHPTEG